MASSLTSRAALLLAASLSASLTPVLAASSAATSTFNYMTAIAYTVGCAADNPRYSDPAYAACCHASSAEFSNPAFAASCFYVDEPSSSLPSYLASSLSAYEATASTTATATSTLNMCNVDSPVYSSMMNNQTFAGICASEMAATQTIGCHASNPELTNPAFYASCYELSNPSSSLPADIASELSAYDATASVTSFNVGGVTPTMTMSSAALLATTASVTTALTAYKGAAASRGVAIEAVAAALGLVGVALL